MYIVASVNKNMKSLDNTAQIYVAQIHKVHPDSSGSELDFIYGGSHSDAISHTAPLPYHNKIYIFTSKGNTLKRGRIEVSGRGGEGREGRRRVSLVITICLF